MRSFPTPSSLPSVAPAPPRLETPLGFLRFQVLVGDEEGEPFERYGEDLPCLCRVRHDSMRADLLLFAADWPAWNGMRVDARFAAVWRIQAFGDLATVKLLAQWEPGARTEEGGYDSGERLLALTWDGPDVRLSVGTSDEEMLAAAAVHSAFVPSRLARAFAEDANLMPRAIGEKDGLEVEIPPLVKGESIQIHFLVAWRTGEFDALDVSSWLAVDLPPKEVAALADEALGTGV